MKTPAISEAISPLKMLEREARAVFDSRAHYRTRVENIYKARKRAFEDKLKRILMNDPNAPVDTDLPIEPSSDNPRRFVINDATYEALGEITAQNKHGVLVYRDELMSLLGLLDRQEHVASRGFYLSGWNGDESYTFERITRGQIHINPLCLSMLGSTQPGRFINYASKILKEGSADDGLIQRFGLLIWPDHSSSWSYVDRQCDANAYSHVEALFKWLANPDLSYFSPAYDALGRPYLGYADDAMNEFVTWLSNLEYRLRSKEMIPALESHFAKYRKIVPALSLIFHAAELGRGPVTASALRKAIGYSHYLESHALRAYSAGINVAGSVAVLIAKRLRSGEIADNFTARCINQNDWSGLTDRELVEGGLEKLCEADWLRASLISTGGRPKTIYTKNPRAFHA